MQLKKKKKPKSETWDQVVERASDQLLAAQTARDVMLDAIRMCVRSYVFHRHDENYDFSNEPDRIRIDFVNGQSEPFIQVWRKDGDESDRVLTSYGTKHGWPSGERYYPEE